MNPSETDQSPFISRPLRFPLRVVFYYELDRWIAHCLEFDLIGDGERKDQALQRLTSAIEMQIAASLDDRNLENLFSPAPGRYFEMFFRGRNVTEGELHLHVGEIEIENIDAREYAGPSVS